MKTDERDAWRALYESYRALRVAVAEEDVVTAERIWRRALTIQGKSIPPYPPSSPQDTGAIGEPPFTTRPLVDEDRRRT